MGNAIVLKAEATSSFIVDERPMDCSTCLSCGLKIDPAHIAMLSSGVIYLYQHATSAKLGFKPLVFRQWWYCQCKSYLKSMNAQRLKKEHAVSSC